MKPKPTPSRDDILIAELVRANTEALRALSRAVTELAAIAAARPEGSQRLEPTTVKMAVSPELLAQLSPPELPEDEEAEATAAPAGRRMPTKPAARRPE